MTQIFQNSNDHSCSLNIHLPVCTHSTIYIGIEYVYGIFNKLKRMYSIETLYGRSTSTFI